MFLLICRLGLVNHTTDGHTFQKEQKDILIIIALGKYSSCVYHTSGANFQSLATLHEAVSFRWSVSPTVRLFNRALVRMVIGNVLTIL